MNTFIDKLVNNAELEKNILDKNIEAAMLIESFYQANVRLLKAAIVMSAITEPSNSIPNTLLQLSKEALEKKRAIEKYEEWLLESNKETFLIHQNKLNTIISLMDKCFTNKRPL